MGKYAVKGVKVTFHKGYADKWDGLAPHVEVRADVKKVSIYMWSKLMVKLVKDIQNCNIRVSLDVDFKVHGRDEWETVSYSNILNMEEDRFTWSTDPNQEHQEPKTSIFIGGKVKEDFLGRMITGEITEVMFVISIPNNQNYEKLKEPIGAHV